jgi:hypothetical protein
MATVLWESPETACTPTERGTQPLRDVSLRAWLDAGILPARLPSPSLGEGPAKPPGIHVTCIKCG